MKFICFCTFAGLARPDSGRFSRSRLRGAKGGRVSPRQQCGSRPGSVARVLGVQSGAIWQESAGSLSAELDPTMPMETPPKCKFSHFFHPSLLLFLKYHSSRQRLGSHGTISTFQAFPLVTAASGASAWVFVRVCVRVCHCRILQQ